MESKAKFKPNPKYRLMDQVLEVLRYYHYAYRTEQSYCSWILQYIKFYGDKIHPKDMGKHEVERFLSHLAEKKNVAAATQKQALNALIFLYKKVLDIDLGDGIAPTRSKRRKNLPTVFTQGDVRNILANMNGKHKLMAQLLYGCGLRLMECVRLRVKDVDFGQGKIFVRNAKGEKDRAVNLPESIRDRIQKQIDAVISLHKEDLKQGFGEVYIPEALARKYKNWCQSLNCELSFSNWAFTFLSLIIFCLNTFTLWLTAEWLILKNLPNCSLVINPLFQSK